MTKGTAGFLPFLAGLIAIAAVAYLAAPEWFTGPTPPAETTAVSTAGDTAADKPADAAPAATEMAKADSKSGRVQPSASGVVPSFDVLRVEPDGSMVLAGKAEPGALVEIINGDAVIASATAGPQGDFVIILDEPLAAGDYQLTLRATGGDGAKLLSEEVATVSIPEGGKGELLAMVSKPGEPSRILAQPQAPAAASPTTEIASAEPAAATDTAKASAPASPATGEAASVVLPDMPATSKTLSGAAPEIATANTDMASTTPAAPMEQPAAAQAGTEAAAPAAADAATPTAPSTEVASAPAAATPATDATVRVDAIEIEGDMIFIAGSATPGYTVRVAADDVVIGSAVADENGRFIVEQRSPLSVGDHTISADLIAPGSTTVMLRAAVPFNRPQGETMAAVAGAEQSQGTKEAGKGGSLKLPELASLDGLRGDAFGALANLQAMLAAQGTADAGKLAEAKSSVVQKLESVIGAPMPESAPSEAKAGAEAVREQARAALAAIEPMQFDASALPDIGKMDAMRASVGDALAGLSKPAMPEDAGTQMAAVPNADGLAMTPPDLRDLGGMREEAFQAMSAYEAMLKAGTASTDELARARADVTAKLQVVIDSSDPASTTAETQMAAKGIRSQAAAALAAMRATDASADAALISGSVASALDALAKPSESMVAAVAEMPAAGSNAAGTDVGPTTITQAPLTPSPHAVIIRRGDTLWQISRRTYGQGVRYTTIYLANLSQIQNPDAIKPGQVFSVPDKPLPNAAELHRKRLEEMKQKK